MMKLRDGIYLDRDGDILHFRGERGWYDDTFEDLSKVVSGWRLKGNEDFFKGAALHIPMELML